MNGKERWAVRLATWFGCGYSPTAPGTVGAIGAIPVHLALRTLAPGVHTALVLGVTALGVWSAGETARLSDQKDPQSVVIDEVAGVLMAMGLVRDRGVLTQAIAFALFRYFDITKPGPVYHVQHTEPAGVGIMMDDVLAGLMAGIVARLIPGRR